jgi:hypothetical protein
MEALLAALARPPTPRWRPVALVGSLGLVLAGAGLVASRTGEPPRAEALKPESVPLTLELGARYEFEVPGVERVAVGSVDIVNVRVMDSEKIQLEPIGPGSTPLLVWIRGGPRRTYTVTVRPH